MKRVVSISLGSSKRDHKAEQEFGGQLFSVERIGTDGDKERAIELIRRLDGKVDAFGLGGTDLYIYAGKKRYIFKESAKIANVAKITPFVDGSGIKNTLERRVVGFLERHHDINFKGCKTLVVCAVDRFGLAEALTDAGAVTVFGDLLFGLGLPIPIKTLNSLARFASVVAPVITKLPISMFYPTGEQQNQFQPRFGQYFNDADVIAGDFHFIRRYMPEKLSKKIIITNTVTQEDEQLLKSRGVATLVTTTPAIDGRVFGTNIIEAILVAFAGKRPDELSTQDYGMLLDEIGISPQVRKLS
ncbi:MAG: hypothetical protein H6Q74_1174 [Firmicutes bacterium]|nr:hypothetical protein [Bacillota bacterium]